MVVRLLEGDRRVPAIAHWKERRLPTVIGRLFNTVGPRQTGRYGMVIPNFVTQALAGRPLTVFGDGTQRRCFCHVSDVVRALADLMEHDGVYGEVFNIGSGRGRDPGARRKVREATGSSSEIKLVPYDEAYEEGFEDMQRRIPDTTRIRERIGWEPTKSWTRSSPTSSTSTEWVGAGPRAVVRGRKPLGCGRARVVLEALVVRDALAG